VPGDDAKGAPGTKSLALDGETKCRKTCNSNSAGDGLVSCPFNYTCLAQPDGNTFCVEDTAKIEKKDKGQWGAACNPSNGSDNPDCDRGQEFYCFAESPTDGKAYCTRYGCETDRDFRAKFLFAKSNGGPSADSMLMPPPWALAPWAGRSRPEYPATAGRCRCSR